MQSFWGFFPAWISITAVFRQFSNFNKNLYTCYFIFIKIKLAAVFFFFLQYHLLILKGVHYEDKLLKRQNIILDLSDRLPAFFAQNNLTSSFAVGRFFFFLKSFFINILQLSFQLIYEVSVAVPSFSGYIRVILIEFRTEHLI